MPAMSTTDMHSRDGIEQESDARDVVLQGPELGTPETPKLFLESSKNTSEPLRKMVAPPCRSLQCSVQAKPNVMAAGRRKTFKYFPFG